MSRTSKYYEPVKEIHRQTRCRWCGKELEHAATGRAKRYCSAHCRVYFNRAMKEHASACVDAALAGEPEPEMDFGHPVEIGTYVINDDGTTTRRQRNGGQADAS